MDHRHGTATIRVHPRTPARAGLLTLADAELAALGVGDAIGDGFLEVRRAPDGFRVYDGEAGEPVERAATREEARDFVIAIKGPDASGW